MKKILAITFLYVAVSISFVDTAPAYAAGNNDRVEACKAFAEDFPEFYELFFGSNLGGCVKLSLNKAIVNFCEINYYQPVFNGPYRNRGQCVSDLQAFFG